MGKLSNRVALITGAGTELGRAIALTFANEGATVILNGRWEEKLQEIAEEIGEKAHVIFADMTSEDEVKELHDKLIEQTDGKLDILVNNTGGVIEPTPTAEMTLNQWESMFSLNATSQFLSTRQFLPLLRASGKGKIISITSGVVNFFTENMGAYAATQGAQEALMKTVAAEEEKNNVQVNIFDPLNAYSEGNQDGEYDPMNIVGVLADLAGATTVERTGEIIRPKLD